VTQLTTDLIGSAAFDVLDRRGIPGFTMRAVAKGLSVTPMALYNHVPDKAGLAALIVDLAIDQYPPPYPSGDWRHDLLMMAHWMREGSLRHPALQGLQQAYWTWTPLVCDIAEHWIELWQLSGLDCDRALLAGYTSALSISGLVDRESMFSTQDAQLIFPAYHDDAKTFEVGVRAIIEGLHVGYLKSRSGHDFGRIPPELPMAALRAKIPATSSTRAALTRRTPSFNKPQQ
jgi:AcrR family transcriptional regulator